MFRLVFKSVRPSVLALLALLVTAMPALAGRVHLTGSTSWSLGSLKVSGSVVGLQSSGFTTGYIRFVGYGYCYTATGEYWTPSDLNQQDDDPNKVDNYPETRLNISSPTNKLNFSLTMVNPPGASQPYAPCAPGTWVWNGASLQVWENYGAAPGRLWDQQNFTCFPKKNGTFDCR